MRDTPRLIRPADLEDAAGIAEVQVSAWRVAYQDLMPKAYLDSMDVIQRTEIWRRIAIDPEVRVIVAVDAGPTHLTRLRGLESEFLDFRRSGALEPLTLQGPLAATCL